MVRIIGADRGDAMLVRRRFGKLRHCPVRRPLVPDQVGTIKFADGQRNDYASNHPKISAPHPMGGTIRSGQRAL